MGVGTSYFSEISTRHAILQPTILFVFGRVLLYGNSKAQQTNLLKGMESNNNYVNACVSCTIIATDRHHQSL